MGSTRIALSSEALVREPYTIVDEIDCSIGVNQIDRWSAKVVTSRGLPHPTRHEAYVCLLNLNA